MLESTAMVLREAGDRLSDGERGSKMDWRRLKDCKERRLGV